MKNILITGCSSGIGYCVAKGLKDRGYRVIASARKHEDVKRLEDEGFDTPTIKYLNNIAYIPGSSFRCRFKHKLKSLVSLGLMVEGRKLNILDIKKICGHDNTERESINIVYSNT